MKQLNSDHSRCLFNKINLFIVKKMEIYIKNMVCDRCIKVVKEEFAKLGLHPLKTELGIVNLEDDHLTPKQRSKLTEVLNSLGFDVLDSKRTRIIEQIKNAIINRIFHSENLDERVNWSKLISDVCFYEYNYLSTLFSSVEEITIEQYVIRQKIERVKELLFYDELNLGEIANKLGYSSIAHLSAQFKKVTGQTPSLFKKARTTRTAMDSII
ncbi:AraC-type DNA-binding protein [Daejeonella rubra]|uniref:AraC-type DNA-binding protein n=2 Tax=Daejeonella rubra TaxID=990371 RepID=A0A1G9NNA5_9SPHI|nr:AraC-type DNA-binding protein [Daejeonella rubra]